MFSRASRSTSCRTNRRTVPSMDHIARLALFHQHQQFQITIQKHQRFAVSPAVWDSSARFETTLSMELRTSTFKKCIHHAERGTRYPPSTWKRISRSTWQQRAHMVHKQQQLVQMNEPSSSNGALLTPQGWESDRRISDCLGWWNRSSEHPQGFSNQTDMSVGCIAPWGQSSSSDLICRKLRILVNTFTNCMKTISRSNIELLLTEIEN